MNANKVVIEQELRDVYYNPETDYQSAERFYQKAKEKGLNVSRKIVQDWLKTQDISQLLTDINSKEHLLKI